MMVGPQRASRLREHAVLLAVTVGQTNSPPHLGKLALSVKGREGDPRVTRVAQVHRALAWVSKNDITMRNIERGNCLELSLGRTVTEVGDRCGQQ